MTSHTLSAFRSRHGAGLDELMTDLLGQLHAAGLIDFDHVAQGGIRVRASAGAASDRREPRLEQSLAEAQQVLAAVQAEAASGAGEARSARQRAARQRAARQRVERLDAASAALPAARTAKPAAEQDQARVSTTDAEARVMKMADGGFRPAYNVQLAADTGARVIVGVEVTPSGSDRDAAPGMVAQVERRLGALPDDWLLDGGFAKHAAIEAIAAQGPRVLAPVPTPKAAARDPHAPLPKDSAVIAAWRIRMGADDAKATYKRRAATIEGGNAQARAQYGLTQVRVRGLAKVRCVALWMALAHNLRLLVRRGPARAAEPVAA